MLLDESSFQYFRLNWSHPFLIFQVKQEIGDLHSAQLTDKIKVSLKTGRPIPFTLRSRQSLERIQLTVQSLVSKSYRCPKRETTISLKLKLIQHEIFLLSWVKK
jgi:hypothetical protein